MYLRSDHSWSILGGIVGIGGCSTIILSIFTHEHDLNFTLKKDTVHVTFSPTENICFLLRQEEAPRQSMQKREDFIIQIILIMTLKLIVYVFGQQLHFVQCRITTSDFLLAPDKPSSVQWHYTEIILRSWEGNVCLKLVLMIQTFVFTNKAFLCIDWTVLEFQILFIFVYITLMLLMWLIFLAW